MNNDSTPKLTVPPVYSKILPRHGIARIIDNSALNEAICLTGPYGCGKTYAVISWLQDKKVHWIDLDQGDNSVAGITSKLSGVLNSDSEFRSDDMVDVQGSYNDSVSEDKLLVFDNFHCISDKNALTMLKDFISANLGKCKIIITSRAELPPAFNDLILKGNIRLITANELNFNMKETAEYFSMHGYSVPESDVARIHSETEGWLAALNAILTASHSGNINFGDTARGYIMLYFETEVWAGLSDSIKTFLLKTSILERLSSSVCYAVTGIGETIPILKELFMSGLFISKLEYENTYRYHKVFRDFLQSKLEESGIDQPELYTKVGWWHFERGELSQAFPYFFKADYYYGINQILKILNPAEIGIEKYLEMASCITTLNIEDLKSYSILVLRIALIHFLTGNLAEMQRLSALFFEWFNSGELLITSEEYGEYFWEAGWLRYIDPAISVVQNIEHEEWSNYHEYVPDIKPTHFQRHAVLGLPSALRGLRDHCGVVQTVDAFIIANEESGRSILRNESALFHTELINAEYSYELENFAKAEEIVRRVMVQAEASLHIDLYFIATCLLVKIMRAMNNVKEIDSIVERLKNVIYDNNYLFLLPNFHAFQLRNRLAEGHSGFTDVFLVENERCKDKPYYYLIYRQFTYMRALISLDNYSETLLLLGNMEMTCIKYRREMDLIELNILRAIAYHGLGFENKAQEYLLVALNSAEPYGYIRIFSDDAVKIWDILDAVRKQTSNKYIQSVVISCKKTLSKLGRKPSRNKFSHIDLTKTELKVLKSLQANMSYMEIAIDNDIRMSTVKSHVHSIYSKLGVNNKTSAIIAAIDMGIID